MQSQLLLNLLEHHVRMRGAPSLLVHTLDDATLAINTDFLSAHGVPAACVRAFAVGQDVGAANGSG